MSTERLALATMTGLLLGRVLPWWAFFVAVAVVASPGVRTAVRGWMHRKYNDPFVAKLLRRKRKESE